MNQEKDLAISLPASISAMSQVMIFGAVSAASFFVPFLLGHPQWLVGTIVNACLFLGAIYLPKKYFLPLAVFPSLGVLARGLVFGPFTWFLIYFLPFIWLGNLVLIFAFRYASKLTIVNFDVRFVFSAAIAATAKFLFLFSVANVYFKFHFVPAVFLQTMGLNQLATALAGGLVAFLMFNIYGQYIAGSRRIT